MIVSDLISQLKLIRTFEFRLAKSGRVQIRENLTFLDLVQFSFNQTPNENVRLILMNISTKMNLI
jgi:hypothetical protein